MAINTKDFTEKIDRGIKASSDFKQFLLSITIEGKRYRAVLDYTAKTWDKRTRLSEAKRELQNLIETKTNQQGNTFTPDTKLNVISDAYFQYGVEKPKANWTAERKRLYELYIMQPLGSRAVSKITLNMINQIRHGMKAKGLTKQTANGCSARTVNKVLWQTLRPILQYAKDNGAIMTLPPFKKEQSDTEKKVVQNGFELLSKLYNAIMTRYADVPFYRAMFLFALYGRRWNEIATLSTDDINLKDGTYTIRKENSKTRKEQTFTMPSPLHQALIELAPDQGLIFRSPKTGGKVWTPKKQLLKLKEDTNIDQLTMHYFRHILSTAMMEMGEGAVVAAATLGHSTSQTTEQFYASMNNRKHSADALGRLTDTLDIER